jgi:hypothetical protein
MLKRLYPFAPLILLVACMPDISAPEIQHAVIQTLTATVLTPTPSATPEPNTVGIVDILNIAIRGADPLEETIDAKFSVIDASVIMDRATNQATTLSIHADCEWVFSDGCTPEQTFVVLMRALRTNDKIIKKLCDDIPSTIRTLQVVTFDRMTQRGVLGASWNDIVDYAIGKINGNQLGSRIVRLSITP